MSKPSPNRSSITLRNDQQPGPESRQYDTIIIGAGMSGLACASKLLEHHSYQTSKKLLVLEARDRIGGRIGSVQVNGHRLDTGANWIHGIGTEDDPNPLVGILPEKKFKELKTTVNFRAATTPKRHHKVTTSDETGAASLTTQYTVRIAEDKDWVQVHPTGLIEGQRHARQDLVIPPKVATGLFGALWGLIGSLHELASETSAEDAKYASLLQAIANDKDFKSAFEELPAEYHQTLQGLPQFVENMEAGPLCTTSPSSGSVQAGLGLLEFAIDDFDGKQVFLHDGYTAVVEEVGRKVIDQGHVELGAAVQQIKWDGDLVQVTTTESTYTAKTVVCTLPLGVLQHNENMLSLSASQVPSFFSPPLPNDKVEAINSLGFGTLDKIFLVYQNPWWKDEPWVSVVKKGLTRSRLGGSSDSDSAVEADTTLSGPSEPDSFWGFTSELPGFSITQDGACESGPRALSLINLHALTGSPVLSAFVSCTNAHHIESLPSQQAAAIVHRSLTRWFGHEPPKPTAVHVTRWHQDPFSRGSYSHMVTGLSETRHRECFASPVVTAAGGAELRFAGEHTSRNHFATVHGALLSGWREAEAILEKNNVTSR